MTMRPKPFVSGNAGAGRDPDVADQHSVACSVRKLAQRARPHAECRNGFSSPPSRLDRRLMASQDQITNINGRLPCEPPCCLRLVPPRSVSAIYARRRTLATDLGKPKAGQLDRLKQYEPKVRRSSVRSRMISSDYRYKGCSRDWPRQRFTSTSLTSIRSNTLLRVAQKQICQPVPDLRAHRAA